LLGTGHLYFALTLPSYLHESVALDNSSDSSLDFSAFGRCPGARRHRGQTFAACYTWPRRCRRSKKYNAQMNYAMFLHGGEAIHQYHGVSFTLDRFFRTQVSDWFGSHGCVRLTEDDAHALLDWTPLGAVVKVVP